jgi:hypothetical protein
LNDETCMSITTLICNYCKTYLQQLIHKIFPMRDEVVKSSLLRARFFSDAARVIHAR